MESKKKVRGKDVLQTELGSTLNAGGCFARSEKEGSVGASCI